MDVAGRLRRAILVELLAASVRGSVDTDCRRDDTDDDASASEELLLESCSSIPDDLLMMVVPVPRDSGKRCDDADGVLPCKRVLTAAADSW